MVSGISQFTRQSSVQMIVGMTPVLSLQNKLINTKVNIAEMYSHVIGNSKAITVRSFDIN